MKKSILAVVGTLLAGAGLAASSGFAFLGVTNRIITPNGDGKNDTAEFLFQNPAHLRVSGKVFDMRGGEVAVMTADCPDDPSPDHSQCLRWNASSNGHTVTGGVYVYVLLSQSWSYSGTVVVVR